MVNGGADFELTKPGGPTPVDEMVTTDNGNATLENTQSQYIIVDGFWPTLPCRILSSRPNVGEH